MSTPQKTKKATQESAVAPKESSAPAKGATSEKSLKSAKARRAEMQKRQQRNQQILLGVVAVVGLILVIGAIVISSIPPEATIPDDVKATFSKLNAGMQGTTPEGFPFLGAANAPVVLEEFASFACPHCKDFHTEYINNLLDKVNAGQLKIIIIPLTQIAFPSEPATKAALCAGQQGHFWEFHQILYDWQQRYVQEMNNITRLKSAAGTLGMDTGAFTSCIDSPDTKKVIDAAQKLADDRAIPGTPTVYLDGKKIDIGNPDLNALRGYIEAAVANKPK